MQTLNGVQELRALVGTELGTSDWHTVTQARIDAFAAATLDFEAIHVDPQRAALTPWGVTIAHGLYTLALGPALLYEVLSMRGHSLAPNYGFDRVRFVSPVRVDSRLRMTAHLDSAEPLRGGTRFRITQTFQIDGEDRPACVAESLVAYFD
ncbi:MAG: putative enoyl-CoA hydratase [Frankiales bacterium]|nr:putative enoyl-CoA hydratase [Frankiales bacterium]